MQGTQINYFIVDLGKNILLIWKDVGILIYLRWVSHLRILGLLHI